jgi:hypothetical protein
MSTTDKTHFAVRLLLIMATVKGSAAYQLPLNNTACTNGYKITRYARNQLVPAIFELCRPEPALVRLKIQAPLYAPA